VTCEIDGCRNPAAYNLAHGGQRICQSCAADLAECERPFIETARFPRAAAMLEATAIAAALRQAADELDELAGAAHAYEPGTLRRKVRAIALSALAFADGSSATEGDS
jgi:hypothetical protein